MNADKKQLDRITEFFGALTSALEKNPGLVHFLNHPAIDFETKKKILVKIGAPEEAESMSLLVKRLIAKRQVASVPKLYEKFESMRRVEQGIKSVVVTSASPLTSQQQEEMVRRIVGINNGGKPQFEIDPLLISGFTIALDSYVIDNSTASELKNLASELSDFCKGH